MQLNSFLILFMFFSPLASGQGVWVNSGQVVDLQSNEPLVGANVYSENFEVGATTDQYGRFSINVQNKNKILIASYIGYQADTCYDLLSGCYFELKPLELEEIIVKAESPNIQKEIGRFSPSMEQIKTLPALLGDVDIMKAVTLLPGVTGGVEGSAGILVRGGNLGHNLILLDGTPVYNSTHLFGFMSAFNPSAVKHICLYKGGFPAQYGGRLASILDITMKDGSMRKRASDLSIGLVNSSFMTEGPIIKDKVSYMLAGRLFNLSPILGLGHAASKETASYWVYDFNGKIKYKIGKAQSLYFSYFQGKDLFGIRDFFGSSKFNWGNRVISLRYNNQLYSRFFIDVGLYRNRYSYTAISENKILSQQIERFTNSSGIEDISEKLKAKWVLSAKYRIHFGVEWSQKKFIPVNFNSQVIAPTKVVLYEKQEIESLVTNDFVYFMENDFSFIRKLNLKIGGRGIIYKNKNFGSKAFDVRASLSYKLAALSTLRISFDEMNQPFHLLNSIGASTPNEVWIPSVGKLPFAKSTQLSLGYEILIPGLSSKVSIEVYTKRMKNLIRYKPGVAYVFIQKNQWQENIIARGEGKAYGLELFMNRSKGRFTGWLGYTLSWSRRKYIGTNNGEWFSANFERRHDVEVVANFWLSKKWDVSSTFTFQTGRPITLPVAFYLLPNEPFGHRYNIVFDRINDSRTKTYHRLDLSFRRKHITKRNNKAMWTFGVYNVYARKNPFSYRAYLTKNIDDVEVDTRIDLLQKSWFTFVPSINYSIKF